MFDPEMRRQLLTRMILIAGADTLGEFIPGDKIFAELWEGTQSQGMATVNHHAGAMALACIYGTRSYDLEHRLAEAERTLENLGL
jgi:hypothetical protein